MPGTALPSEAKTVTRNTWPRVWVDRRIGSETTPVMAAFLLRRATKYDGSGSSKIAVLFAMVSKSFAAVC